jgi:hypothetical protein
VYQTANAESRAEKEIKHISVQRTAHQNVEIPFNGDEEKYVNEIIKLIPAEHIFISSHNKKDIEIIRDRFCKLEESIAKGEKMYINMYLSKDMGFIFGTVTNLYQFVYQLKIIIINLYELSSRNENC